MTSPNDDQIRAMLEARADRPDGASRRTSWSGLSRPPAPVGSPLDLPRLAGAIAAAALVAAVGAVFLVNQAGRTREQSGTAGAGAIGGSAVPSAAPSATPSLAPSTAASVAPSELPSAERIGNPERGPNPGRQPALPERSPDGPDPELAGRRGQPNRRSPGDQQGPTRRASWPATRGSSCAVRTARS